MADIYFWRQVFIVVGCMPYSICVGFMLAFPSVLNPAITSSDSNNAGIKTTEDHASWIASINGIGGVFGSFIISPLMQSLGRKACIYCMYSFFFVGWMILPFARNITALYAARFIQGISIGGIHLTGIIISEYVHPKRRGYLITMIKVTNAVGVLSCHTMGVFFTWRQIAMCVTVLPLVCFILVFFWPESPSFLALQGRVPECESSFTWLNGNSEESQIHLKSLLEAQVKNTERSGNERNSLICLMQTFVMKEFQKVFLISIVLNLSVNLCGRYYAIAYAIQIMMELTDNQSLASYFTIGGDLVILIGVCLSVVVMKYVNRRTILYSSGVFAVILMILISILGYLKTIYTFSDFVLWFLAITINLQSFVVNTGLNPVISALFGEIFPLEHKGLGAFASCFVFTVMYSMVLKVTPVLLQHTELYGTFAIYGVGLAICLVFLYKTLPETRDKTLQDIEIEFTCTQDK